MRDISVEPLGIFLEPVGLNTAPAAAIAALTLLKRDTEAVIAAVAGGSSDSIDYAVMEHTQHAAVAPTDIGWKIRAACRCI